MTDEIKQLIAKAAEVHKIDPLLVEAIVEAESEGNSWIVRFEPGYWEKYIKALEIHSKTEEILRAMRFGLMQITGQAARELGFRGWLTELLIPQVGLEFGCRRLSYLSHVHADNLEELILAFRIGSPRKINGEYLYKPYIAKVKSIYTKLREEG